MPSLEAPDWLSRSRDRLASVGLGPQVEVLGRVEEIGDGIAQVSGLPDVRLDELLHLEDGLTGFAMSLDADRINAVLLDAQGELVAGARVKGSGDVLRVPVGKGLLGRVVDPLGRPLDGGGPAPAEEHHPVERPAPSIIGRDAVDQPVATGTLVVDALFALGRGQRELIIGDRATGKTSLAIDAIISQKNSDIVCVYVAVGQRSTAVERVIEAVRRFGAPERCIFVVAAASAPPGLQWIAPFSGITMAEYFRDRGGHALVIIDDLTKHAATHRELSLLTRAPPGREAYPGDIFYLHARLLERAARLAPELGGGTLTALPIAETDAGNLSAYIPTNLISITDGQIVLDAELFAAGQRPAVNVGLSVSRVGGKAQAPVLRAAAKDIRLVYSQFLELEMFTRFGGMSDQHIKSQMTRGRSIRALLTQPRLAPLTLSAQLALLVALHDGLFDSVDDATVARMKTALGARIESEMPDLNRAMVESANLPPAVQVRLLQLVREVAAVSRINAVGAGAA